MDSAGCTYTFVCLSVSLSVYMYAYWEITAECGVTSSVILIVITNH